MTHKYNAYIKNISEYFCVVLLSFLTLLFAMIVAKEWGGKDAVVISGQSQSIERSTESAIKSRKKTKPKPHWNPKFRKLGLTSTPCPSSPGFSNHLGARLYFCQIEMCLSICSVLNIFKRFAKSWATGQAQGKKCRSSEMLAVVLYL